ncbi:hypothetical protein ACFX11_003817 [Malus domestica]
MTSQAKGFTVRARNKALENKDETIIRQVHDGGKRITTRATSRFHVSTVPKVVELLEPMPDSAVNRFEDDKFKGYPQEPQL